MCRGPAEALDALVELVVGVAAAGELLLGAVHVLGAADATLLGAATGLLLLLLLLVLAGSSG